jgi:rubredoxin
MEKIHLCVICGHVHNEAVEGRWDELGADFECPECGCGKDEYETLES